MFPEVATAPGIDRQILAEHPGLMVVAFHFETDSKSEFHRHPHVQASYVVEGSFTLTVGDRSHCLKAGDAIVVPSNIGHCCVCNETGTIIDTFTPRRDDFL